MNISIVIPAYNEGNTITRCLKSILNGPNSERIQVIVVCNGCTDDTVANARKFEPDVTVLELKEGSKPRALNAGDDVATYFPRFYIDADIEVSQSAIWGVAEYLSTHDVFAAAPRMQIKLDRTSSIVRAYYRAWLNTPYTERGMLGSGFYALSEKGRARFEKFPDIIADDGYMRLLFSLNERATIQEYSFTIYPPKNLKWLIKISTRAVLGNYQLEKLYPELQINEENESVKPVLRSILQKNGVGACIVYFSLKILFRIHARFQILTGKTSWDHDPTARS